MILQFQLKVSDFENDRDILRLKTTNPLLNFLDVVRKQLLTLHQVTPGDAAGVKTLPPDERTVSKTLRPREKRCVLNAERRANRTPASNASLSYFFSVLLAHLPTNSK